MINENKLMTVKQQLPLQATRIRETILALFDTVPCVYSYIVTVRYKHDQPQGYEVKYHISEVDDYNTILIADAATSIERCIVAHRDTTEHTYCIGYDQPPVDLMIELFEPYLCKLAYEQSRRWRQLDMDDLHQIACMSMLKLYSRGYYINRKLLRQTFVNDLLMELRKYRHDDCLVSYERLMRQHSDDHDLKLIDTLEDVESYQELLDIDDASEDEDVTRYKRELVINEIGQRQYDQLVREYGNKATTAWSRKTVSNLKQKFSKAGLTDEELRR